MKKTKGKISNIISNIVFTVFFIVLITIFIALLVICSKTNKETKEISDFMGYKPVMCLSDSMQPEFKSGDLTICKKITQSSINVGDIITYRENNEIIIHRVIAVINEDGEIKYQTKGDNNNIADENMVLYENIEGKIVFTIPLLGKIILMLKNPMGFLIVFFIPVSIIAITYKIIVDRKEIKELRKRKLLKRLQERKLLNS